MLGVIMLWRPTSTFPLALSWFDIVRDDTATERNSDKYVEEYYEDLESVAAGLEIEDQLVGGASEDMVDADDTVAVDLQWHMYYFEDNTLNGLHCSHVFHADTASM